MGSEGSLWSRGCLVSHCILVESDLGLILIDTGLGTGDLGHSTRLPASWRCMTGPKMDGPTALAHVRRLGFAAEDVRHLVPTHLDLDHAGGLGDFPDAEVHVYTQELEAATHATWRDGTRYVPSQWAHGPKWKLHDTGGGDTWFGFESVRPIAALGDELALVPLTGHSRGHCGVAIRNPEGHWILHAGDAFFHRDELLRPPRVPVGLRLFQRMTDFDRRQRLRNSERVRALHHQSSAEVTVVCAHDPVQLAACQTGHRSGQ